MNERQKFTDCALVSAAPKVTAAYPPSNRVHGESYREHMSSSGRSFAEETSLRTGTNHLSQIKTRKGWN